MCEPQKPAIAAGLPRIAPVAGSSPSPAKSSPGQTRCWCPVTIASIPSTPASWKEAFSSIAASGPGAIPEWLSATTTSAPASRISGTQARAASRMSRTANRPSRWPRSQSMICGGTKPISPTRIARGVPAPSTTVRSSST